MSQEHARLSGKRSVIKNVSTNHLLNLKLAL